MDNYMTYPEFIRTHNVTFTPEEYHIVIRAVCKGCILLLGEYNNTPSAIVEDFVASIQLEGIDILNYKCNNMYIRKLCQYVTIPTAKMYWNAALGQGNWNNVSLLSGKYCISNKVKEVSNSIIESTL